MKRALITGITGQDGSYLADLLLEKGYEVHGIIRRASTFNTSRIDHLYVDPHINGVRLFLHYGDLADSVNLVKLLYDLKPDEIYHLGAQSHVRVSFDIPEYTGDVTGVGTIRILEAIRETGIRSRFYQASSSEMFGNTQEVPQNENTRFWPRSPYGVAKVFSYWATINYRESYGLCASNAIMFNHESPRRGETFVTRKITRAVAAIKHWLQQELFLGNLDAKRDWGYAPEYVEGVWRILQNRATLLGHCVGYGKTALSIIAAHELKRLGLARKTLAAVPNHLLVTQWQREAIRIYPELRILAPGKRKLPTRIGVRIIYVAFRREMRLRIGSSKRTT